MDIDIQSMENRDRYLLMTNIVVPRPIAWVTSKDTNGTYNAAPFSFFNVMSANPPVVGFNLDAWKDTVRNISETSEFVINIVPEALAERMNITAFEFAPGENELELAGLTPLPSKKVSVPGIAESPIHIECRRRDILKFTMDHAESYWVIGDVLHVHVDDSIWENGRIRYDLLKPLARMGGSWYTRVNEDTLFRMPRLKTFEKSQ